ncbi:MAG: chorismate synthase [Actinobacteria bacterium]|nr:chorismate synthase [Actinomycetota bacterium]
MRYLTGGESHGPSLAVIIDGLPAGLVVSADMINRDLARRQSGYGRGGRMKVEKDRARIISGVRLGVTLGSPVSVLIENKDHENWAASMSPVASDDDRPEKETRPRPGHGDLAGMLKYGTLDARDILERASARETAARTVAGSLARVLLESFGIKVASRVVRIGGVEVQREPVMDLKGFVDVDEDVVRCADKEVSWKMVEEIEKAAESGDSVGGVFEVAAFGLMPGLGSMAQHDRRLDGRLAGALASIPGIKGVETGDGFSLAGVWGSRAHDEILYESARGIERKTNRAGGLEAGMTNGEPLVLRAAMKPIPSLRRPLSTVDMGTLERVDAFRERADVCAVPAASVVGEAAVCFVLAEALCEKFGGDSLGEIERNVHGYLEGIKDFFKPPE